MNLDYSYGLGMGLMMGNMLGLTIGYYIAHKISLKRIDEILNNIRVTEQGVKNEPI